MRRIGQLLMPGLFMLCFYHAGAQCNLAWAEWNNQPSSSLVTGIFSLHTWNSGVSMTADHPLTFAGKIYHYSRFDTSPARPDDTTICQTSWAGYGGGRITSCFNGYTESPYLLLGSVGSSTRSLTLHFSVPYKVIYYGSGIQFVNDSTLTGTEGYCVIIFPGIHKCIDISSASEDDFTQLTWGIGNGVRTYFEARSNCKGEVQFGFHARIEAPYTLEDPIWNFGDGIIETHPIGESPTHYYSKPGAYVMIVTIRSSEPCTYVYYDQVLTNYDTLIENPQTVCKGKSYQFNNNIYTDNGTYYDTLPRPPPLECKTIVRTWLSIFPDSVYKPLSRCRKDGLILPDGRKIDTPGRFFIPLVSPEGCAYVQITDLRIIPEKKLSVKVTDASCPGSSDGSVHFNVEYDTAIMPCIYMLGEQSQSFEIFPNLEAGVYRYNVLDRTRTCATSGVVEINQPQRIMIDVRPNNIMIHLGEEVTLKASGNYEGMKFRWLIPPHPSICDSCEELTVKPDEDTRYPISAKVQINDKVCTVDSFASIRLRPILFSPTAFTPNNDGLNDHYSVDGLSLHNIGMFEVLIHDRWGALVYQSTDAFFKWDGTVDGKPAADGVYVCTIRYRITGKEINQPDIIQNITLLR